MPVPKEKKSRSKRDMRRAWHDRIDPPQTIRCPRCNELAASGTKLDECLCYHGEENAITQSAYHGVNIKDATLYTTYSPCLLCTKMIINSGIREVVFNIDYPLSHVSQKLLKEAGVDIRKVKID